MSKTDTKMAMEELTNMLLYPSHYIERDRFANEDDKFAWKGYDFDVLNKLDEKNYIRQVALFDRKWGRIKDLFSVGC